MKDANLSNTVDLLVHLSPMVITFLTSASYGERHARRMPRADTRHLAQTFVRLALKFARVPARRHSYTHNPAQLQQQA